MIRPLFQLLRTASDPRRVALFLVSAVLAVALGFVLIPVPLASRLIKHGGYYYILGLFALFLAYAWRVAAPRRAVWLGWLRRPGWVGAGLAAATAFTIWSDPIQHKILFDEYVLQSTAYQLHAAKEVGAVVRGYHLEGSWVPIDTFVDKRPYFYAFLISLLHDFTGYRVANAFVVNLALTPLFLGLVYWLARELAGRGPALFAVALLATMPLLGQNATSAGMELHNLTVLAAAMAVAVLYLRAPDAPRLGLFLFTVLLLAQSRYESVIFVVPAAVVIALGWLKSGRVLLPWPALVAPLLLVPYAWHNRVLAATPVLWQLREGETSRFSAQYLTANLEGAWSFLFNTTIELANSWWLSAVGTVGVIGFLVQAWRWARLLNRPSPSPAMIALVAFGAGIAANLVMLMFYYWSHLDDVIASRFALPACLLLALLGARLARGLERLGWPATRLLTAGLAGWVLFCGVPAMAARVYTDRNLVMQEVDWELEQLGVRPGSVLYISNKSTLPFLLWRVPTVLNSFARVRGAQIRYHVGEGTFREVILAQALRPTSARGDLGVDPDDLMPPEFQLETIAQKRFGGRWIRLSRVTVAPPAAPALAVAGPP